jgi:hypothetical protein
MAVLAVVALVVESYRALIRQAVQPVHLEKVTLEAQAQAVRLAVNQAAAVVELALPVLPVLNFTVELAVMVLHHLLQAQALPVAAVVAVEFCKLVTSRQVQAVLAAVEQEVLAAVLDQQEQQILAAAAVVPILLIMSVVMAVQVL